MIWTGPDPRVTPAPDRGTPVPGLRASGKPAIKRAQRAASAATRLRRQCATADAPTEAFGDTGWCATPHHPPRVHSWGTGCEGFVSASAPIHIEPVGS